MFLGLGASAATRRTGAAAAAKLLPKRIEKMQAQALMGAMTGQRPRNVVTNSHFAAKNLGTQHGKKIVRAEKRAALTARRHAAIGKGGRKVLGAARKHPFYTAGGLAAGAGIATMVTSTGRATSPYSYDQTRGMYGRSPGNPTGLPGGMY